MKGIDRNTWAKIWQRARPLLGRERWRRMFTRDIALKLISLGVAFGLWAFVNASERDTEIALQVPLELRNIPAALMITSPRVDFVDLRVSGPRTLLSRIDRKRLSIPLDLAGVRPGPAVFRINADSLSLPRGVKILRITPAQVTLDLERVLRRTVPVRLQLGGKLPPDLHVVDTRVSPESIQVIGPGSDVDDIKAVETAPLDLSHAEPGKLERELNIPPVSEYVSFSAQRVAAQVQIAEIDIEREMREEVVVRNATGRAVVYPETVRVTVRGPKHVVQALELSQLQVYIDATGAAPGRYERAPTVDAPASVTVVRMEPAKVRLRLMKGKRP
jgi:YbbR-like protein